ncbi:MAG: SCP2 sterol-binding domain-containing protein [Pseudomonadota bacterium]
MSEFLEEVLVKLQPRLEESSFGGTAKLDVTEEGAILITADGAEISDAEADVTLTADVDTVRSIFNQELDPTSAFMTGKLAVDGDMGVAMQLAQVLS